MSVKQMLTCFIAIGLGVTMLPLQVNADAAGSDSLLDYDHLRDYLYEGPRGEAFVNTYGSVFLVITNSKSGGTVLNSSQEYSDAFVLGEMTAEQFDAIAANDPALDASLASSDSNPRAFLMSVSSRSMDMEDTLFRKISLSPDVLSVTKLPEDFRPALYWNGDVSIQVTDAVAQQLRDGEELETLYPDLIGADSCYQSVISRSQDWYLRYQEWVSASALVLPETTIDHATQKGNGVSCYVFDMSAEETADARSKAELETDYEILYDVFDACDEIVESRPDVFLSIVPHVSSMYQITADLRTSSLWKNVGDLDGDSDITASDSNEILMAAASKGAGENSGLSIAAGQLADVNADGVFNAEDAAILLMYAAEQGSGSTMTLEEFVSEMYC